jgi:AraC family transcriptional regulator
MLERRPIGSSERFTVDQTHGILRLPEHHIQACSDTLGWTSLYASTQREAPYQASFAPVKDHLIIVHLDGPVEVSRDLDGSNLRRLVQPGGLFILPAHRHFRVRLGGSLSTVHVYVRDSVVREAAAELASGDPEALRLLPRLGERDELIESAARAAGEIIRDGHGGDWIADSLAHVLAVQLVRRHSSATCIHEPIVRGLPRARLNRALAFMEEHIEQTISLHDMATAIALSPVHFSRAFKLSTGTTPHQYLLMLRVERAKRLLSTDLPIAEVALRCGFSHQEHLTRVFGRLVGLTPSAYRRNLRG